MEQNDSCLALTFEPYDTDTQPMPMGDVPPSPLLYGAYYGAVPFVGDLSGAITAGH